MKKHFRYRFAHQGYLLMFCPKLDDKKLQQCYILLISKKYSYDNKDVPAWFGTGGAGFCISRKLANKMEKLVTNKQFEKLGAKIQAADDVTIG